ncbi:MULTISPECIES: hypothetical protein [unclassified Streptomyces]|uniref:hypothetical protein n=1 Tax=unclassified Streptomyces TaxID=2593676 RepID=UPI00225B85DC|nr:hypothetical protein [Streptomyces sp. NBC_00620]MCX4974391.1 hypothetical protein [Streptomyces sp. NBC_00620]WTB41045.1 hypothetical protein OG569_25225 [Streptomyces sp. NBC_00827]WUC11340.1 hypothetical protein OG256_16150 [Streptomyces sp. NBC_00564]WUC52123.1 hypothetical protein OG266_28735 [Streptomyces sp. NBC_00554]
MKSLKAAAVVAGSIAIAGAAAPAFAYEASDLTPTSLNGALETITSQRSLSLKDVQPLQHQSDALNTENQSSPLSAVSSATDALNSPGGPTALLGGLPLQG